MINWDEIHKYTKGLPYVGWDDPNKVCAGGSEHVCATEEWPCAYHDRRARGST
jgi:hypothetical protein